MENICDDLCAVNPGLLPLEAIYVAKSRVLKRLREKVLELAEEIPTLVGEPRMKHG